MLDIISREPYIVKHTEEANMARADLHTDMMNAMTDVVLRRVEGCVKNLRPDTSAIAPEHIAGFESGFKAAKRAMLDLLAECT